MVRRYRNVPKYTYKFYDPSSLLPNGQGSGSILRRNKYDGER